MPQHNAILDSLYIELQAATTSHQLVTLIHRLSDEVNRGDSSGDYNRLRLGAFGALVDLTRDDPTASQRLILDELLPLCIQSTGDEAGVPDYRAARYREVLIDWLGFFPWSDRAMLRDAVLDASVDHLNGTRAENASWLIAQIGYRSPKLIAPLWNLVATQDTKAGDAALAALTVLENAPDAQRRIRDNGHARIPYRFSMGLLSTLRQLADPASLEPVLNSGWFDPPKDAGEPDTGFLALRLLIDIADAHGNEALLQDRVWRIVSYLLIKYSSTLESSLYLGSDVAPRCDSPDVIVSLLRAYTNDVEANEDTTHRHHLLCLRLEECVRLRHLAAWSEIAVPDVVPLLLSDACRDTEATGRWRTTSETLKEAAWHVLLRLGDKQLFARLDTILRDETNGFMQAALCDIIACFRLDRLPSVVHNWVTERHDAHRDGESLEWAARMAAIRVARSAASREAFDALLHGGFTFDGRLLRQSVDALAEVATRLVRAGDTTVADALLAMAKRADTPNQRTAAIGALPRLANHHLLSVAQGAAVAQLLDDETVTTLERSLLIETLGDVDPAVLTPSVIGHLLEATKDYTDNIGWRAVETLIHQDAIHPHPEVIERRFALTQAGDMWEITPGKQKGEWDGYLVGLLYGKQQQAFALVVAALFREGTWQTVVQIAEVLRTIHRDTAEGRVHEAIESALFDRIRSGQQYATTETALFDLAAQLAPDRLAREGWNGEWNDWRFEARAALAEALRDANFSPDGREQAVTTLTQLMSDGVYGVRRAAYRGILRLAPATLLATCAAWRAGDDVLLRERAAEAIGWLEPDAALHANIMAVQDLLLSDPEPTVRETALRALRDRRERQWAQECVARVRNASGGGQTAILRAWPYGQALRQIGDDDSLRTLTVGLDDENVPLHVRHWWEQLIKGIEERWQKVTEKWPDPWRKWDGKIEEGEGQIIIGRDGTVAVHYRLWYEPALTLSDASSWSGTGEVQGRDQHIELEEYVLKLQDNRQGTILVSSASFASAQGQTFAFSGQGQFPI